MMHRWNIPHAHKDGTAWYTVYCKPNKETMVASALEASLSLHVYLPEICTVQRGRLSYMPCFPRYLFVQANLQAMPIHHIYATPNVLRLVGFGAGPQVVPAAVIAAMHQQVEQLSHHTRNPEQPFRPGDAVRLREGPLRGLEGQLLEADTSRKRVKVLIHMLGQLNRAEVDIDALEHADTQPVKHRTRRTRGRGRQIRMEKN